MSYTKHFLVVVVVAAIIIRGLGMAVMEALEVVAVRLF
jgi:hypothetical protein